MFIYAATLANAINECRHITPEELTEDSIRIANQATHNPLKHYKVYFEIYGKNKPVTWFCFAADYAAAKQAASDFLKEELSKGFYSSGMILSIKEI